MDLLEHPLEAVAFRLYSIPEAAVPGAAAAWTCLAAVLAAAAAAAAGIWRLRAAAPVAIGDASSSSNELEHAKSSAMESEQPRLSETASSSPALSPKERYTAYFYDSCCVGCCDVEDDDDGREEVIEEEDGGEDELSETTPFEWEVVRSLVPLSPTAAEMGRYRESGMIGGSVVRLWDHAGSGGLTAAAASPRRRGRAGSVVSAF
uniref:Uncharacterized protein n=1 Tax=Leersia perrieri TaxID=77586 RepID=A0A0D9WMW8_9ORYZ